MIIPLEADDIKIAHDVAIERYGGVSGEKDAQMIEYISEKPFQDLFGVERYPGFFTKAAVYMHAIATLHCFNDANKRTAVASTTMFLEINGYFLVLSDSLLYNIAMAVAKKRLTIERLAALLERHSHPIQYY